MKVGLANNVRPARFSESIVLGRKIVQAVDERDQWIKLNNVDPKFALPDANWSINWKPNDFRDAYKLLATFDWEQVKYLRFRARNFNGFSLRYMKYGEGHSTEVIPADFDEYLSNEIPTGLLGDWYARIDDLPYKFIFRPRGMLGEVGWLREGVILNADTVAYQERMYLLFNSGLLSSPKRILEIGGGYGALAYAITSALPDVEYWICDLPASLLFSGMYLTMTTSKDVRLWPERGPITLVPNYMFHQIACSFDLVINTLSFAEMTELQVRTYLSGIRSMITYGGLFEQNYENNDLPDGTHQTKVKTMCAEEFSNRTSLTAPFSLSRGEADVWRV